MKDIVQTIPAANVGAVVVTGPKIIRGVYAEIVKDLVLLAAKRQHYMQSDTTLRKEAGVSKLTYEKKQELRKLCEGYFGIVTYRPRPTLGLMLGAMEEAVPALLAENAEQAEEIERLRSERDGADSMHDSASKRAEDAYRESEQLRAQVAELEAEVERLREEYTALQNHMFRQADLEAAIKQLIAKLETYNKGRRR